MNFLSPFSKKKPKESTKVLHHTTLTHKLDKKKANA